MIKTLGIILRLRNCYTANGLIHGLRSIPFAKKILPATLYANRAIKTFANIVALLYQVSTMFFGKLIYFIVMFFALDFFYIEFGINIDFIHMLIFLSVAGAICNNRFDNATRDSYYAIFLMRLPAREYALTEMFYFLFKTLVGFIFFSILCGLFLQFNITEMILVPIFATTIKIAFMPLLMHYSQNNSKAMGRSFVQLGIGFGITVIGVITGLLGFLLTQNTLIVATVITSIISIASLSYLVRYKQFKEFYRKLFVTDIQLIAPNSPQVKKATISNAYGKQIANDRSITSKKKGFAYFNDLFVKRHRKMLSRSAVAMAIIIVVVTVAVAIYCMVDATFAMQINGFILMDLPFFLFVMYIVNCGNRVTLAMFANCDSSMLKYGFYRKPSSLLKNFSRRLGSLIVINLIPGTVIAICLPVLLYVTGGTDEYINYLILAVCILAISVFFSVHSMVLYYLLQPYNKNMELKSPLFSLANTVTYILCYVAIGEQLAMLTFCIAMICFCLLYIVVALLLVYKLAPKTFRLRD